MTTENHTCNNCSRSTKRSPCPNCENDQFCVYCNQCNVCGPKPQETAEREAQEVLATCGSNSPLSTKGDVAQLAPKPTLSLRKLRDRLSDIIAEKERNGHPERADLPIHFRLTLEHGRGEWYIPSEWVAQSPIGLRLPDGLVEMFEIRGHEDMAIKNFAHRARRNSGKGTK